MVVQGNSIVVQLVIDKLKEEILRMQESCGFQSCVQSSSRLPPADFAVAM